MKFTLCNKMASAWYNDDNVVEAFVWWVRAVVSQINAKGRPVLEEPFMYLAYIADSIEGDKKRCRDELFRVTDSITRKGRLNGEAIYKLTASLSRQTKHSTREPMRSVLRKFCGEFL
jgi:hypothetical protein